MIRWSLLLCAVALLLPRPASADPAPFAFRLELDQHMILAGGVVTGKLEIVNRAGQDITVLGGLDEGDNWRWVAAHDGEESRIAAQGDFILPPPFFLAAGDTVCKPVLLMSDRRGRVFHTASEHSIHIETEILYRTGAGDMLKAAVATDAAVVFVLPAVAGVAEFTDAFQFPRYSALAGAVPFGPPPGGRFGAYERDYRALQVYGGDANYFLTYLRTRGRAWLHQKNGVTEDVLRRKLEAGLRLSQETGMGRWIWSELAAEFEKAARHEPLPNPVGKRLPVRFGRLLFY